MSEYIDIVTVKGTDGLTVLRSAPPFTHLREGDQVMFESTHNPYEMKGTVIDNATFNKNRDEYRLLKSFASTDIDMKITKRIFYEAFDYGKGEE